MIQDKNNLPNVSVLIPCYNEEGNIGGCLDSLIKQDYKGVFEIVVVDNGSKDESRQIITRFAEHHPNIRLVIEQKKGTSIVRNTGVKNARYEYIGFIDADCEAPPDWLSLLVNNYRNIKSKHPEVIAVGGRNIAPAKGSRFVKAIEIVLDSFPGSFNSIQGRQYAESRPVSSLSPTNAFYEKEKISAAGYFDETLKSEAEDAEINYRLFNSGHKFYFIPDSYVWHKMRATAKTWFKNMFRYGKGRARLLKRYPEMWSISYVLPPLFLMSILSVGLSFISPLFLAPLSYFLLIIVFSLHQTIKKRAIPMLGHVMLVYAIQHFGYALGEMYGLINPKVK
ncbi:glycosyltransferase [Acidobacteriota bacterium]